MFPTIAIIHHREAWRMPRKYMINLIAGHWEAAGFTVRHLFGPSEFQPADLAFLHVDLSVVPTAYQELASRYPAVVNGKVLDIRKTTCSTIRVSAEDSYDGPVIVKSSLNSAGWPESYSEHAHLFGNPLRKAWWRLSRLRKDSQLLPMRSKADYRIFRSKGEMPPHIFQDERLIAEKFLPERTPAGEYCLREYYFLGDIGFATCEVSRKPVFTAGRYLPALCGEPPPAIEETRRGLGMGYGKIDFSIHQGSPVPFDVNKTTGMSSATRPRTLALARMLAGGILHYFPELHGRVAW